ncbi:MAG: hypothetical protein FGM52_09265 [Mycobacterium sp.]|nr:hypothetical protein [Mycobacterium sp.]
MSRQPLFAGVFPTCFGVLMVAAGVRPVAPWGLAAAALAGVAVLAGLFFRPASVVAVLVTVAGMALGDQIPVLAAVSGLSAAAYLLTRYGADAVTLTVPTALGMLGFTAAGVAATAIGFELTWAPLVAPAIMAAILIVVAAPLFAERPPDPGADRQQRD